MFDGYTSGSLGMSVADMNRQPGNCYFDGVSCSGKDEFRTKVQAYIPGWRGKPLTHTAVFVILETSSPSFSLSLPSPDQRCLGFRGSSFDRARCGFQTVSRRQPPIVKVPRHHSDDASKFIL